VDGDQTADTGTVFYGQKTGKMTELMFGIFVKPVAKTTIEDLRTTAIRAREAYETTQMERDLIHGYVEEIGGHLNRFTEVDDELSSMHVQFLSMNEANMGDFTATKGKLDGNKTKLEAHYGNVTEDVNTAANLSNYVDATYSTTVANTKAAEAEDAASEAVNERKAATNEYNAKTDASGSPTHAVEHAKTAIAELITEMMKMEKALVLGGSGNGVDNGITHLAITGTGGTGYTDDTTITIDPPPDNLQPAAPTLVVTAGAVTGVTDVTGGWGYFNHAPTVTVDDDGHLGESAIIDAVITNGRITGYTITNSGSGYTTVPTVTLTSNFGLEPAGITAIVTSVTLNDSGGITNIGYDAGSRYDPGTPPSVTIDGTGIDASCVVSASDIGVIGASYQAPASGTFSSDAFHYVHTELTDHVNSCNTIIDEIEVWKSTIETEMSSGVGGGASTANYTDDLEAIADKTAELTTIKNNFESIRTNLNAVGGDSSSLRGGGWNHNVSKFNAAPEYDEMEAEFEKMDALLEASDHIVNIKSDAVDNINTCNTIRSYLNDTLQPAIEGRDTTTPLVVNEITIGALTVLVL
jgi:hypothetical protein